MYASQKHLVCLKKGETMWSLLRHFENRRGEGPGDEVGMFAYIVRVA